MKICIKCGVEKRIDLFYKGNNQCKECKIKYTKEYKNKKIEENLIKGYKKCLECKFEGELLYFLKYEDKCKECHKKVYYDTKDKYEERRKEYRNLHKEERKKYWNDYYSNNENKRNVLKKSKKNYQERYKEKKKLKYQLNKEEKIKFQNLYFKKRINIDPLFKIKRNIKEMVRKSFLRKGFSKNNRRTEEIIGCKILDFKIYIESKFETWMTWENKGLYNGELNYGWDIDHIIPLDTAKTEEDIIKLNHYTNLQPLCSYINRCVKRNQIEWKMED
jgi:hypothetical protein